MKRHVAYLTSIQADYPATGAKLRIDQIITALGQIDNVDLNVWRPASGPKFSIPTNRNAAVAIGLDLVVAGLALSTSYLPRPVTPSTEQDIFTWLHQINPEIILIHHDVFTGLVPRLYREGFKVIADTHNVETAVAWQSLLLAKTPRQLASGVLTWTVTRKRERTLLPMVQEIWTPAANDAAEFRRMLGDRPPVSVVPNAVDISRYMPNPESEVNSIGFFGDMAYPPNAAAAERLLRDILPAVRQMAPPARLYLVGRNPSPGLQRLAAATPGAVATGAVDDTRPWMARCAVHVAPLEYGSGTRLKILEGLAMAKPMVSTPKGCEGLDVRDGEHLLVRDMAGFPAAVALLLADLDTAQKMGQRGRILVDERYSLDPLRTIIEKRLEQL